MNFNNFINSLQKNDPPPDIENTLEAIWYAKKHNWHKAHQIAQNIPDGWIDPNVIKQAGSIQNLMTEPYFFDAMEKIELEELTSSLQVHFSQTATHKELFYLLAIILLGSATFLFFIRQRLF